VAVVKKHHCPHCDTDFETKWINGWICWFICPCCDEPLCKECHAKYAGSLLNLADARKQLHSAISELQALGIKGFEEKEPMVVGVDI
jgi:hypothetical protein